MPIVSPESFDTSVKQGRLPAICLLFGDEEFLIEESLERLLAASVDDATRSFNFDLFHGSDAAIPDIVERALSYPMMAERRVVAVRDIDRVFALRGKPDAKSSFARYLANPLESTLLVMTAATSEFMKGRGGARAPWDMILERGTGVQFKKVYDREIPSWTAARIRSRGREITPEGVELFVGYVGASLRVLDNEIEKLFTFVQERKRITADDVRSVVGVSRTYNVFELQKAVGARNLELSVQIAERMLRAGESEQLVLTMLTRYFNILWRLQDIRSRTRDQNEMARAVGVSSFFLGEYLAALGRYSQPLLQNAFEALLMADLLLKTSNVAPSTVLQMMLVSIVGGRQALRDPRPIT